MAAVRSRSRVKIAIHVIRRQEAIQKRFGIESANVDDCISAEVIRTGQFRGHAHFGVADV